MLIISDSSPLICFIKINRLDILRQLFETVIVPPIVYDEIRKISDLGFPIQEFLEAKWISIHQPADLALCADLNNKIDAAEAHSGYCAGEGNSAGLFVN